MQDAMRSAALIIIFILLTGCAGSRISPQVVDRTRPSPITYGQHVVQADETLYAIAWRYGRDFRELASINGIKSPYLIHSGQIIRLSKSAASTTTKTKVSRKKSIKTKAKTKTVQRRFSHNKISNSKWKWPANGKIISRFHPNALKRNGIDIAGRPGASIFAAKGGKVVYSGSGLRGLGQLIIIKHSDEFLSAYAHNKKLLVKEGDLVKVGQKIAEMGHSGADRTKLHFEIRRNGKPVDPLAYLQHR